MAGRVIALWARQAAGTYVAADSQGLVATGWSETSYGFASAGSSP